MVEIEIGIPEETWKARNDASYLQSNFIKLHRFVHHEINSPSLLNSCQ